MRFIPELTQPNVSGHDTTRGDGGGARYVLSNALIILLEAKGLQSAMHAVGSISTSGLQMHAEPAWGLYGAYVPL